jgi:hypothetical protein
MIPVRQRKFFEIISIMPIDLTHPSKGAVLQRNLNVEIVIMLKEEQMTSAEYQNFGLK